MEGCVFEVTSTPFRVGGVVVTRLPRMMLPAASRSPPSSPSASGRRAREPRRCPAIFVCLVMLNQRSAEPEAQHRSEWSGGRSAPRSVQWSALPPSVPNRCLITVKSLNNCPATSIERGQPGVDALPLTLGPVSRRPDAPGYLQSAACDSACLQLMPATPYMHWLRNRCSRHGDQSAALPQAKATSAGEGAMHGENIVVEEGQRQQARQENISRTLPGVEACCSFSRSTGEYNS